VASYKIYLSWFPLVLYLYWYGY